MNFDQKEFFHQATIRICSELDIQKALEKTLIYLNSFIPATELFLTIYEPLSATVRIIAQAMNLDAKPISQVIILPKKFQQEIEEKWKTFKGVEVLNYDQKDDLMEWFNKKFNMKNSSRMHMTLDLTGQRLGLVGVRKENFIYKKNHSELLELLHEPFAIALSNALRYEEIITLKDILYDDNLYLQDQLKTLSGDEIIGADFGLKSTIDLIRQVAPLTSPVLLLGESGVGKEVIANGIHSFSERNNKPFIKVNCGAIPDNLIDSELFGHEKGSFTGALEQRRGRFERANTGTIFLDEIGELSHQAQVRLLRAIQNKEIERVGGGKTIPIDVRIIAATNKDLLKMVQEGNFREDLWFRINVFPILIPPLRARQGDIPALVHYFLEKKSKEFKIYPFPKISSEVLEYLQEYHWPGNVRELENAVERAIILGKSGFLRVEHFYLPNQKSPVLANYTQEKKYSPLNDVVKEHIQYVLDLTDGQIHGKGGAAEILKINPNTLRSKMRKLKISFR